MSVKFGPAGNSEGFSKTHKSSLDAPKYLKEMSLNAYEYQCGKGVKVSDETAMKMRAKAEENGISMSLHAPYFISLSSVEPEKRDNSIRYILESASVADKLGAKRIIIHSGSCAKLSREEALELAKDTLIRAKSAVDEQGLGHIIFCPETMGKINQLGNLAEVVELCKIHDSFLPCIDFGHLNARTFGGIKSKENYAEILDTLADNLGEERASRFHSHFSKIEFSEKGGEVRHLTFEDELFGPRFEPLMELVAQRGWSPTFICESAGTQDIDALAMKKYYESLTRKE